MLTHLRIRDLIVVEEAVLEFADGLNVLSGSTGAGKSVLLAALALVTGARARSEWIRPNADRAIVEAYFRIDEKRSRLLEEAGFDCSDGELHLKREIRPDGRGQAWSDGFPITVRRLRELGEHLLERQDQHAQLSLADAERQLDLLDDYALSQEQLAAYREQLAVVRNLRREEEALAARLKSARDDEEYLRFQLEEIDELSPAQGEREELADREKRLRNAARLQEIYREGMERIEEEPAGLQAGLDHLAKLLERAERLEGACGDPDLPEMSERLSELAESFREKSLALAREAMEGEALAERLGRLTALERKHGRPLDEVIAWAEEQRELLDHLADQDRLLAERARKRSLEEEELSLRAEELSLKRRTAAALLGEAWQERLALLGLDRATLRIEVCAARDPEGWITIDEERFVAGERGIDRPEILVRTNPDLPEGSLSEVPSGGELSRIAFARHLLETGEDPAPVLVLDEVDAGIGADLAGVLSGQLRELATRRQVLAVTHQAALAAAADRQFCVRKEYEEGRTRSLVHALEGEERLAEISRMLGESGEERARALAASLLARSGAAGG